jgi:signal transduction histidine kinase
LLDNAIKYSFRNHEVRIRMSVVDTTVVIVFRNYGVGVPEEKLKAIREIGERGEVFDPKRERSGFGVGLSIAIHNIEAHGGSLDIDSHSADADPRRPGLRFVTKVTVTVPLAEQKEER